MTRTKVHVAQDRRWQRGDVLAVLGAVLLGCVLAAIIMSIRSLQEDLQTANEARDALAAQVQDLGATPVAGKPGSRGEIGPSGPPGPAGPAGRDGADGSPAPTITPSPGAMGPRGPQGAPGSDSTVPGPSGAPGRDGVDGKDGKDGVDGQDGEDGVDGTDGRDGTPPVSWTFTDSTGKKQTCTRAQPFDPNSPRYTCSAEPGETPVPPVRVLALGVISLASYRWLT